MIVLKVRIGLFIFMLSFATICVGGGYTKNDARNVVNQYFAALSQGDILAIKDVIGGKILQKRRRLLDNPTYPAFLSKIYQSASFEIVSIELTASKGVKVTAKITLNNNESMPVELLLQADPRVNRLLIVDEREI